MKVLGLTGSVGMGKSVAATLLRRLGVAVHDSDTAVHALLSPGSPAFTPVSLAFPEAWDKEKRLIDRRKLGAIVFADPHKRAKLEAILHPLVQQSQMAFIRKARRFGLKLVVLDIPLLYETGAQSRCDAVAVVSAPFFLQRQRVLSRPGMTEERFYSILQAQMPDIEKRRRADKVIASGMGRGFALLQLKRLIRTLTKR